VCAARSGAWRNIVSGKVLQCRRYRPARCVTLSRPVLFRGWTTNESAAARSRALLSDTAGKKDTACPCLPDCAG